MSFLPGPLEGTCYVCTQPFSPEKRSMVHDGWHPIHQNCLIAWIDISNKTACPLCFRQIDSIDTISREQIQRAFRKNVALSRDDQVRELQERAIRYYTSLDHPTVLLAQMIFQCVIEGEHGATDARAKARYYRALSCFTGEGGVERSYGEAFREFSRLVQDEDAFPEKKGNVHLHLGLSYMKGLGVEKSLRTAFFHFQKIEEDRHASLEDLTSSWFYRGLICQQEQSFEAARDFFLQAANHERTPPENRAGALKALGKLYVSVWKDRNGSYETGRHFFEQVERNNDFSPNMRALARLEIALMYRDGVGVERSNETALRMLKSVADDQAVRSDIRAIGRFRIGMLSEGLEGHREMARHHFLLVAQDLALSEEMRRMAQEKLAGL